MLFNSLGFIFVFLPLTYFVFWSLKTKRPRHVWLTVMSYVFYGFWNYKFCALMLFSTLVSYFAGLAFLKYEDERRRKLCLIVPVTIDLLLLGFFKYFNFACETVTGIAAMFHSSLLMPYLDIILPVGISFYTFHTISYIVDSYRKKITPTRDFFEYACYVSLFSQLVCGPIVRFWQIEDDLKNVDKVQRLQFNNIAWSFFTIGMIEKVLIADSLALFTTPALKDYAHLSTVGTWLTMLAFAYRYYFDFLGYSDMAVGLGYLFGLHIPQNFNSPYKAIDGFDFFKRWHISLSNCLRDYVFIPLGGMSGGRLNAFRCLMVTMLICGLWHGARWNFVIWGLYAGLAVAFMHVMRPFLRKLPTWCRQATTFFLVYLSWVLFCSDSVEMCQSLYTSMFTFKPGSLDGLPVLAPLLLVAAYLAHVAPNSWEVSHEWKPLPALALSLLFIACLFVIYGGGPSPFLYFQF